MMKAIKAISIFLVSVILIAAAVYFIGESRKYDEEQVKSELMDSLESYMIDFKQEHPEAVVEFDFSKVIVLKERTLLDNSGSLEGTAGIIISSPEINAVLEKNEYTYDDFKKIDDFDNSLELNSAVVSFVYTDNYSLSNVDFSSTTLYRDSNSNIYYTDTEYIREGSGAMKYSIIKNNEVVFEYTKTYAPVSSPSSSSSRGRCTSCNGSGKKLVTWYSNGDWGEKTYSSYTCTACGGDGYR